MARKKKITEEIIEEGGTPAIFLRKVDVVIQDGEEEPIIIKAKNEDQHSSDNL